MHQGEALLVGWGALLREPGSTRTLALAATVPGNPHFGTAIACIVLATYA